MAKISVREWIAMMRTEKDRAVKRREQLLFDIASFVLRRAKHHANENFGRGIGKTARTRGRSGALRRSIEMARESGTHFVVTAGGPGVPYARTHELGATIRPREKQWLTIPLKPKYVGRRAPEFDLRFVQPNPGRPLALLLDAKGAAAYLLLKRVDIPARPYLAPAARDAGQEERLIARLKVLYGTTKLPYKVVTI